MINRGYVIRLSAGIRVSSFFMPSFPHMKKTAGERSPGGLYMKVSAFFMFEFMSRAEYRNDERSSQYNRKKEQSPQKP